MGRPVLARALASIAAQTYPSLEVIVIAACGPSHPSPGNSGLCGRHPLRLVGTGTPLGRAAAANFGVSSASHDLCIFLDDDDAHSPRHIAGLMESLQQAPESRLAYSAIRVLNSDGRERTVISSEFDLLALHRQNYIQLGAALFSRSLYTVDGCRFDSEVGAFDDWDFWLQCAQHTAFTFRKDPSTDWYADAGESGAGMDKNYDARINQDSRAAVENKWKAVRDDLQNRFATHFQDGQRTLAAKQFQQAEAHFRTALVIHSGDPAALTALAMLRYARRNFGEARKLLLRATQTPGDQSNNLCNLALIEIAENKTDLATRLLQHALRENPANERAMSLLQKLSNQGI